jgi:hypothetical protein
LCPSAIYAHQHLIFLGNVPNWIGWQVETLNLQMLEWNEAVIYARIPVAMDRMIDELFTVQ